MMPLGDLGGGASSAHSIGNGGHVVGQSHTPLPGAVHAFSWRDGAMTDLGTLGGRDSFAYGVNVLGATAASPERVTIANPMAGTWTAVISGFTINDVRGSGPWESHDTASFVAIADGVRLKEVK